MYDWIKQKHFKTKKTTMDNSTANEENKGFIYILTNPSFPEYVKIGYAKNIDERLKTLNSSSALPFAFQLYASYKVPKGTDEKDKYVHAIIDILAPSLRTKEINHGRKRKREFFAMKKDEAYNILFNIAKINGTEMNLKIEERSEKARKDAELAEKIRKEAQEKAQEALKDEQVRERREKFTFDSANIKIGSELIFKGNPAIKVIVEDNKSIRYKDKTYSLSGLAKELLQTSYPIQGTKWFTYNGQTLDEIRQQIEDDSEDTQA